MLLVFVLFFVFVMDPNGWSEGECRSPSAWLAQFYLCSYDFFKICNGTHMV